jgi:hypothetical protein
MTKPTLASLIEDAALLPPGPEAWAPSFTTIPS